MRSNKQEVPALKMLSLSITEWATVNRGQTYWRLKMLCFRDVGI